MNAFLIRLAAGLAVLGAVVMSAAQSRADDWKAYRLAEATFEAPAGWTQSSRERDREIILTDPAGRELRVEWWFEDEPILGYSDIVSHKRITIGGKSATWVHSSFPSLHSVMAVLDEKRKDGRKLLFVLQAPGRDAAATIRLFDEILARVSFGKPGEKSGAAPGQPPVAAAPAGPGTQPLSLSAEMRAIAGYFGTDCEAVAPASWSHPAIAVIRKRKQARLEWVMLCRNRSHPVFAMAFDYDPQGRTSDFFMPLYDDVLKASGGGAVSFVSLKDKLIIDVTRPGTDQIDVKFREIP
jgi:hypothetical protein